MSIQTDDGRSVEGGSAKPVYVLNSSLKTTAQVTGQIVDANGTLVNVKYAFANIAASQTASSLVAAIAGKRIRVLGLVLLAGATATTAIFNSAGTAISMTFANGANGGAVLPFSLGGWFQTNPGEALTVTTGAGSATGIQICYVEV